MTLDLSKPVITRDGRRAVILRTDQTVVEGGGYVYPIRAAVMHPNEPGKSLEWNYLADGRYKSNDDCNRNDLINEMPWHRWMQDVLVRPTRPT